MSKGADDVASGHHVHDDPSPRTIAPDDLNLLIHANHWNPFGVLGPHEVLLGEAKARVVRAFLPEAAAAWVVDLSPGEPGVRVPMDADPSRRPLRARLPDRSEPFPYRLAVENHEGHSWEFVDPYQFGPVLTDFDLHLLGEGTHYRNFERLGAHLRDARGLPGRPLRRLGPQRACASASSATSTTGTAAATRCGTAARPASGRSSSPTSCQGEVYKFEIKSRYHGYLVQKADPYGFAAELRPKTASVVWDVTKFDWDDDEWMANREQTQGLDSPIAVYEVHLGSWKRKVEEGNRFLNYRELADELVEHLKQTALHPRRADADQRAPVRRQLGLPAGRLLRPDLAVRHARRLRLLRRHAAPQRLSA